MTTRKFFVVALTLAACAAAGAAPALAKSHHRMAQSINNDRAALSSYAYAREDAEENHISAGRASAIHTCNIKAEPYNMISWQSAQFAVYGTCMAENGQWLD
jgi:hypothetical protein